MVTWVFLESSWQHYSSHVAPQRSDKGSSLVCSINATTEVQLTGRAEKGERTIAKAAEANTCQLCPVSPPKAVSCMCASPGHADLIRPAEAVNVCCSLTSWPRNAGMDRLKFPVMLPAANSHLRATAPLIHALRIQRYRADPDWIIFSGISNHPYSAPVLIQAVVMVAH